MTLRSVVFSMMVIHPAKANWARLRRTVRSETSCVSARVRFEA